MDKKQSVMLFQTAHDCVSRGGLYCLTTPRNNLSSPTLRGGGPRCSWWCFVETGLFCKQMGWKNLLLEQILLSWCWCSCSVFVRACRQEVSLSHPSGLRASCLGPVLMEDYIFWKLSLGLFNSLPYHSSRFWYVLYFRPHKPPGSLHPPSISESLLLSVCMRMNS